MSQLTDFILSKTKTLTKVPEISPGAAENGWEMMNNASTEVEVSEFLHSLVRVIKPKLILETGTFTGISAAYMGLALKDNGKEALIHTSEINQSRINEAKKLWAELGVSEFIEAHRQESLKLKFADDVMFDFAFFDSEPSLRFDEVLYFWDKIRPGSIFLIHDLHSDLGLHYANWEGMEYFSWPYGDYRTKLGELIKNHEVQVISLPTPRGLTVFQKRADNFEFSNLLLGKSMKA